MAAPSDRPSLLPIRLTHRRPGLVRPMVMGLAFGGISYGAWRAWPPFRGESIAWVFLGVGILCGLFAVLLLWSCFYQWLLARTPLTLVEISGQPFPIGKVVQIALIQPGPASLHFLRAELVCLERITTWHRHAPNSEGKRELYCKVDENSLHTTTVIDEPEIRVSSGDRWQRVRDFTLPDDAEPSFATPEENLDEDEEIPLEDRVDREIVWQIVLTGKGGPLTRFRHGFEVQVARP